MFSIKNCPSISNFALAMRFSAPTRSKNHKNQLTPNNMLFSPGPWSKWRIMGILEKFIHNWLEMKICILQGVILKLERVPFDWQIPFLIILNIDGQKLWSNLRNLAPRFPLLSKKMFQLYRLSTARRFMTISLFRKKHSFCHIWHVHKLTHKFYGMGWLTWNFSQSTHDEPLKLFSEMKSSALHVRYSKNWEKVLVKICVDIEKLSVSGKNAFLRGKSVL